MNRAAKYIGKNNFVVDKTEYLKPTPDEVSIEVAYTGLCGTDRHVYHGTMDSRVKIPAIIGHEMSGTIKEAGEKVKDFKPGDRVVIRPLDWCGKCKACLKGFTHICQNLKFIGIDSPGTLQNFITVHSRILHRIPENLSLLDAALTEPVAVACHDTKIGKIKKDEFCVVIGGGPIGLLITIISKYMGANCLLIEPRKDRRMIAENLGFKTIDPEYKDIDKLIFSLTDGAGADVVFEVSASTYGARVMTKIPGPRSRVVVVGIFGEPVAVNLKDIFWKELQINGARVYEAEDFEKALELLSSGVIPLKTLISRVEELDKINDAFKALDEEDTGIMKILIRCSD